MRKYLLRCMGIVLIAALCLILLQLSVCAESSGQILSVGVSVKPDSLLEPGVVQLSFRIENSSDHDVENISLSSADGLESEPFGRIAANSVENFTRTHSVTQAELDAGEITFILSHDDPLEPERRVNYGVHAALRQSDMQISAALIRRFSTDCPAPGGTVTVTYRVQNTGNVPLNLLRIQDSFGDFNARIDRLEPGESSALVSRVSVSEPTVSHASLLYCADVTGDESYTVELEDVPIELSDAHMDLRFSADYSAFSADTADVLLTLTNAGSADYENVSVIDDIYGGNIAEGLRIPAGSEPVEVERAYAVRGSEGYRWRVTGRCADGTELNAVTETLTLEPRANHPAQLSLTAETAMPRIRRAGSVRVHIRLENTGGTDVSDVTLTDAVRGELRTFAALPAEGVIERDFVFPVEADTEFNLAVSCLDADGAELQAIAKPVRITISPDGALPEGEREHFIEFTGGSIKIGGSSLFAVLLIAGCAVLLVLVVMLLIASRRARIQKQVRIAAEKRRKRAGSGKSRAKNEKGRAD